MYNISGDFMREYFISITEDGTKKLLKKFKEFNVPKAKQKEIFEILDLIIKKK